MSNQLIEIKYGSYTINNKINNFRETHSYRRYVLDVDFLIMAVDDISFVAALKDAESSLSKDSQTLTINFGPAALQTLHISLSPTLQTGFFIRTTLTKSGDSLDSDRIRKYSFHLEAELPSSSIDDNFRRKASYSINFSTSRKITITFSGTYTAGSGNTAQVNYEANVAAWITEIFTELGYTQADYNVIGETENALDDEGSILDFSIVYQEVLFPESAAGGSPNNLAAIRNAEVSFSRFSKNEHGKNQKGSFRVSVSYSCNVDVKDVTYSGYKELMSLYTSVIKGHLITQVSNEFGGNVQGIEQDQVSINVAENSISANFVLLLSTGLKGLLSYSESIEIFSDDQINPRKLLDGNSHTYILVSFGEKITAKRTVSVEKSVGFPKDSSILKKNDPGLLAIGINFLGGNWVQLSRTVQTIPKFIGNDIDSKGASVKIWRVVFSTEYIWVKKGIVGFGSVQRDPVKKVEQKGGKGSRGANKKFRPPDIIA